MSEHVSNMEERANYCKTALYFKKIFKYMYLSGWPNFWQFDHDVPEFFERYHGCLSTFIIISCAVLVLSELGGFFTQYQLSEKQKINSQILGFSHPIMFSYGYFLTYFQKKVTAYTYSLTVELKELYNDEETETAMLKKARQHSISLCIICSFALFSYGFDGLIQCLIDKDSTFVTVFTAWPDLNDHSTPAICFRILAYILWWIFMIKSMGVYVLVISTFVCLGYQYKHLQSYFYNLNNVFDEDVLTMKEKQEKYEKGLKLGISMHARTLRCTRDCEVSFMGITSGQILLNVAVIMLVMAQMLNSERTFSSMPATVFTMSATLISTGYFMWNAGDVTIEAEAIATAMFSSGWQNCVGDTSVRVRKLLVIAMMQAQVPVYIRTLGIIPMSYESYVSIVKSSYSVFSVLY